jgi:cytochrome c peroxidase
VDVGKLKGPVLRGLASRAPYFHNGSAQALSDVVTFYNTRFGIWLTSQEQQDLAAFLSSL